MTVGSPAESYKPYPFKIEIVDKGTLSKDRLAEAAAAQAMLMVGERQRLLQECMRLAPQDPRYPYWMAQTKVKTDLKTGKQDYSAARPLIELALKNDPKFVPAQYALAMMQETSEKRIAELEKIAETDTDNAQPYLLMAIEKHNALVADKKMAAGSDDTAFDIAISDWQQVSDLLEKFNAKQSFAWRRCAPPSARDIKVSTCSVWSAKAVEATIAANLQSGFNNLADNRCDPDVVGSGAVIRQMARQAAWAGHQAQEQGNTDLALKLLSVSRQFAGKYARHEPYRLVPFLTASAARNITVAEETKVLQAKADDAAIKALDDENAKWKEAIGICDQATISKWLITADDAPISAKQKLQYNDNEAEQAAVKTVLTKAGLISQ